MEVDLRNAFPIDGKQFQLEEPGPWIVRLLSDPTRHQAIACDSDGHVDCHTGHYVVFHIEFLHDTNGTFEMKCWTSLAHLLDGGDFAESVWTDIEDWLRDPRKKSGHEAFFGSVL